MYVRVLSHSDVWAIFATCRKNACHWNRGKRLLMAFLLLYTSLPIKYAAILKAVKMIIFSKNNIFA